MDERIKALALKLTEKTLDGVLDWGKTSRDSEFICRVGGTSVTVDKYEYVEEWSNEQETIIDICILNKEGDQIDRSYAGEVGSNDYRILDALHGAAHRRYFKIDEAIDSLLSDLDLL